MQVLSQFGSDSGQVGDSVAGIAQLLQQLSHQNPAQMPPNQNFKGGYGNRNFN